LTSENKNPSKEQCLKRIAVSDYEQVRETAKYIFNSSLLHDNDTLDVVAKRLSKEYKKDGDTVYVDTMSWLCKILGAGKKTKYIGILEKVAKDSASFKLRLYASHNLSKIKGKEPKVENKDFSTGGLNK
jgi:hypothetical protein